MKIIIVGCGKMGKHLSQILTKEKYDVTVIDKNDTVLEKANEMYDISIIPGNGLVVDTLYEAGIEDADILISTMKNDEDNILCSLLGKQMGAKHTIARVRNPEYSKSIDYIKKELGLSMSINPELLTAKEISSTLRFPEDVNSTYLVKGKVELIQFKLNEGSPLINTCIKDIKSSLIKNLVIVAVERNDKVYVPNGDFKFELNDTLLITSTPKDIMNFMKETKNSYLKAKNAMIVGGSKISYYLSKYLKETNINVKIIEQDLEKCKMLSDILEDTLIINGDGSDKNLLIEEGIENVDSFIACTGIDEENVVFSMFANSIGIPKVITKINHLNFGEILENVGIDFIVTPHVIASNHILRYIRAKENSKGGSMESLIRLLDDNIEIMEFKINDDFKKINKELKNIKFKNNLIIICINRNGKIIFPTGDDIINVNDHIFISTTQKGIKGLNDILD